MSVGIGPSASVQATGPVWRWVRLRRFVRRAVGLALLRSVHDPVTTVEQSPGLVIIQLDGLGHGNFQKAAARGYLPFLSGLIASGSHSMHRWRCGLPADTPPVQAGIMWGDADGIAGFYWWDRQSSRRIASSNPAHMREFESRIAARRSSDGLLNGGSSYSNTMSGGARHRIFTVAGSDPRWFAPGQGMVRALALVALNPGRTLRFIGDALWEVLQEAEDRVWVTLKRRPRLFEGMFPLVRVLLNILARDVITAGTRLDMLRAVSRIYTCYIGYDVVGHHSGPLSRNSLRTLKGIDRSIKALVETGNSSPRPYRFVILSDHGMSPAVPVAEAFATDFDQWCHDQWQERSICSVGTASIGRQFGEPIGTLRTSPGRMPRPRTTWLQAWGRLGAWALELGTAGAIRLGGRILDEKSVSRDDGIVVISCGPLAQIWLRSASEPVPRDTIDAQCPGFVNAVLNHPAVDFLIVRSDGFLQVVGRNGEMTLRPLTTVPDLSRPVPEVVEKVLGISPLAHLDEPEVAAVQIARLGAMKATGDVICFGASFVPASPRTSVPGSLSQTHFWSFERQLGTHATLDGDQSYPFLITPSDLEVNVSNVIEASQLHDLLVAIALGKAGHVAGKPDHEDERGAPR